MQSKFFIYFYVKIMGQPTKPSFPDFSNVRYSLYADYTC